MAEPSTIARPYAEAAFQQARQAADLAGWSRMIARLAAGLQDPATKRLLANPALASRKDLRDSVVAARAAFPKWSASTAYLRGQIIYRIAEMLEGRKEQFEAELKSIGDKSKIDDAIDLIVWYAGWSDKL